MQSNLAVSPPEDPEEPGRWIGEYISPDKLIKLVVNENEEDFHIDARPGYSATEMRVVLASARRHGLELMDDDECEPEILEDGTVRIYLVEGVPPPPQVQPVKAGGKGRKRAAYAFVLAACATGAMFIPSPSHHDYSDFPTVTDHRHNVTPITTEGF
ncbi:hypothetical protein ACFYQA_22520 [Streptomyces sp. NPDC005774]|uniref:hypothetical protein n=1 Tax=Streptomyces sp. NPDC005774 TaxID=3364728 RepID=UPI00369194E7